MIFWLPLNGLAYETNKYICQITELCSSMVGVKFDCEFYNILRSILI